MPNKLQVANISRFFNTNVHDFLIQKKPPVVCRRFFIKIFSALKTHIQTYSEYYRVFPISVSIINTYILT